MFYAGARYQRIASEDPEATWYVCDGRSKRNGKTCRSKLAFQSENIYFANVNWCQMAECRERLVRHRGHSIWCEFFYSNFELAKVAAMEGSLLVKNSFSARAPPKKKQKKTAQKTPTETPTANQVTGAKKNPKSSSSTQKKPASSSTVMKESKKGQNLELNLCGKCKRVIREEMQVESEKANTKQPSVPSSDGAQKMDKIPKSELLDEVLDMAKNLFNYLANIESIEEKNLRDKLQLCQLEFARILEKHEKYGAGEDRKDSEFGQKCVEERNEITMDPFESTNTKLDSSIEPLNDPLKDPIDLSIVKAEPTYPQLGLDSLIEGPTAKIDQTDQVNQEPESELIGLGSAYSLAFQEEYERMNVALKAVKKEGVHCPIVQSDGDAASGKPSTITREPIDHPNGLLSQSKNGYQPNDKPTTFKQEPADPSDCLSRPTKRLKSEAAKIQVKKVEKLSDKNAGDKPVSVPPSRTQKKGPLFQDRMSDEDWNLYQLLDANSD